MTNLATIGHNSAAVGEILAENPALVFTEPGMMDSLLDEVREEVAALTPDTSTEAGRGEIRTLAHSIAKRKVRFDDAGKALNEDHRKAINAVDEKRRKLKGDLEEIQKTCRKPLTEWEDAENDRKDKINTARVLLSDCATFSGTLAEAQARLAEVVAMSIDNETFGDLADATRDEKVTAVTALESAITRLQQDAADREELERLRAEKAEREKADAAAKAKEEAERIEKERIEAATKAAADQAAEDARKAAQAEIDAANKAAAEAQAELDRQDSEKAEAERKQAELEANKKHRSKIMGEAKRGLMKHAGIEEDLAKTIVLAIAAGSVPNVRLGF